MRPDLAVVIRVAGERTADVCRRLAAAERGGGPVIVVAESPFERAVAVTFERAVEAGCGWTLVLDGDVLLRPGAIDRLLARARRMPPHVFQFQGLVCDKLLAAARKAGNRVYRTSLLPTALAHVPPAGTELRPETHVCRRMERAGHPSRLVDEIVGLHDYGQFHVDIYRKAFVFAQKHIKAAARQLPDWAARAHEDADCLTALRGFCDGLGAGFRGIDVRAYPADLRGVFGADFKDKPPLDPAVSMAELVERSVTTILAADVPRTARCGPRWLRGVRRLLRGPSEYPVDVLSPSAIEAIGGGEMLR